MNKIFKCGIALLMGLFTAVGMSAQGMMEALPVEEGVIVGQLPNGLTYYIRHNETPKGQADFYIAQKVGSILEEDNQRGLAHFLEHMCFNGTDNFPGKGIINYCESIGVKFGANLNAYTSVDETVYNISSVPVARQGVQDSCLLILHDWSCGLTLDPAEIDNERGVIHEEWRRRTVGQMRLMELLLPTVYPNNKYGERLPIGIMDVVDNFPPQAIIDYYHTWYRPDQQAIIVVGDIDPAYIEGKIKEIFSPIAMPENAKERYYVPVEDTPGTIVAIGADPEMDRQVAMMFFKMEPLIPREVRNTIAFYPINYATTLISDMLSTRLSDIANKPDSPFGYAGFNYGEFFIACTKDALSLTVIGKDDNITNDIQAAYREVMRALRGGFTVGEYERAKAEFLSRIQKQYDQRDKTPSESYSYEYVRAFIDNTPIPGIETEKQIYDMMAQALTVDQINGMLAEMISEDNRVVAIMVPEAEGIVVPTEQGVLDALAAVDAEDLEPYKDEMRTDPLIPALPAVGAVAAEQHSDMWDATEWTLSNGVKVIVKPTTLKNNDIQFYAIAKGGYSVLPAEDADNIIFLPYAINNYGLGAYSNSDLSKYLQGKQVGLSLSIDKYDRSLDGNATKQDLGTLMELIYAYFTEFDIKADEFAAGQNLFKGILSNQESTPEFQFQQLVQSVLYKAASEQLITSAIIDRANCDRTNAIVKQMLANAGDFTFVFVGDFSLDELKPLVEQYIATLPTGAGSVEYVTNAALEPTLGAQVTEKSMTMTTPQVWAYYNYAGKRTYTAKDRAIASIVGQIMSTRLLNKVREEMGATYSIGSRGSMDRTGEANFNLIIPFPMKPELRNEVLAAVDQIIVEMGQNITADELATVREYMVKVSTEALDENESWAGAIGNYYLNNVMTFLGAVDVYNSITVEDLMNFWNDILAQNNRQLIILNPAE